MEDPIAAACRVAAAVLGHDVPHALPAVGDLPIVAASVVGEPPRARIAWVAPGSPAPLARVACPPGRPSPPRPLVVTAVELDAPGLPRDRILVARTTGAVHAVRILLAGGESPPPERVGPAQIALVRLAAGAMVIGIDALDASEEPVGRLARPGVSELRSDGVSVSGRLAASHGMCAGIGGGRWAGSFEEAAFEAGFVPDFPSWLPRGMGIGRARLEPDLSYPAAPPAIVIPWTGLAGERVLLRQTAAPLASPPTLGPGGERVDIGAVQGELGGRWLATLTWETPVRAYGLQIRELPWPREIALKVARSIPQG